MDWTIHRAACLQLKTHKIARNWNFIKYKSIQISTNAFLNSSDVEIDEMGWITAISHSLLYLESHLITGEALTTVTAVTVPELRR